MGNLHSDVIIEILLRLPVKSLCRFKCVCKLWRFLISHPKFARRHVNFTNIDKEIEHWRRKLILNSRSLSSLCYVEYEAMTSNHVTALELDLQLTKSVLDEVKLIGSFNGLLCISVEQERMFLINPAINEVKKIPNLCYALLHPRFSRNPQPCIYGFGYDHSLDDYKVVRIVDEFIVYVFSLRTDTWRRAQNFPYKSFSSDPGIPLNGAVHWVFGRGKHSIESIPRTGVIVAFDFAEVKLREVPLPSEAAADSFTTVGVLGGCLCWLTHGTGSTAMKRYDFWVMSKYGIKESWTKVAINIPFLCLRPLSYLKNDEALLEIDGKLILYNPREGTHRELVVHGIHGRRKLEMQTYVESLVSPALWQWELEEVCKSDEN